MRTSQLNGEGEEVMVVSGDEEMIKLGSPALPGAERSGAYVSNHFAPVCAQV